MSNKNEMRISSITTAEGKFDIIDKRVDSIFKMVLSIDGNLIRFIDDPSDELIKIALETSPESIHHLPHDKWTNEMWEHAVLLPVTEENFNTHPIHWIHECPDELFRHLLNIFIENDVNNFEVLTTFHDWFKFTKLSAEDECEIWLKALRQCEQPNLGWFCRCGNYIKNHILPDVFEIDPIYLTACDNSLWTLELGEKFIATYPSKFRIIVDVMVSGNSRIAVSGCYMTEIALEHCHFSSDVHNVLNYIPEYWINDEFFSCILTEKTYKQILNCGYNKFNIDREKAELILDKIKFTDLVDDVYEENMIKLLNQLPLFKRIKYKRAMRKYKKCQKTIKEVNTTWKS